MGIFNWFGEQEHRTFDYKPVYYDKETEERRQKFGKVDNIDKKGPDGEYVPGSYIKGSFRDGNYQRTRTPMRRAQTIIGIITLILIFVVLYFIAKFYSML